jgi:hypothetical protein
MVNYGDCQKRKGRVILGLTHGSGIDGDILHYFGCLKFSERAQFLDSLRDTDVVLRTRILEGENRIAKLRKLFEAEGVDTATGKLLKSFKSTLSQRSNGGRSHPHSNVRAPGSNIGNREDLGEDLLLNDTKANAIYFKKDQQDEHPGPYSEPHLGDGKFPDQKVPLSLLLSKDKKKNPLMWKCEDGMIRYFHIPANNMTWIEVGAIHVPWFVVPSSDEIQFRKPWLGTTTKINPTFMVPIVGHRREPRNQRLECFSVHNTGEVFSMEIDQAYQPTHAICAHAATPFLQVLLTTSRMISWLTWITDHENIGTKPKNIVLFVSMTCAFVVHNRLNV